MPAHFHRQQHSLSAFNDAVVRRDKLIAQVMHHLDEQIKNGVNYLEYVDPLVLNIWPRDFRCSRPRNVLGLAHHLHVRVHTCFTNGSIHALTRGSLFLYESAAQYLW